MYTRCSKLFLDIRKRRAFSLVRYLTDICIKDIQFVWRSCTFYVSLVGISSNSFLVFFNCALIIIIIHNNNSIYNVIFKLSYELRGRLYTSFILCIINLSTYLFIFLDMTKVFLSYFYKVIFFY